MIACYKEVNKAIVKCGVGNHPIDKPLTFEILDNPNHPVRNFLLYLHTMETFIYRELGYASRSQDATKIKSLGPYAMCLSYILGNI